MSKKNFIALADTIRDFTAMGGNYAGLTEAEFRARQLTIDCMTEALADFCRTQNQRFDRERWLGYIAGTNGPSGGKR